MVGGPPTCRDRSQNLSGEPTNRSSGTALQQPALSFSVAYPAQMREVASQWPAYEFGDPVRVKSLS